MIAIGQVLKLIGGAAHKKVGSVIAEKFPITKMLDGGPLGGLLSKVLKDGPAALMQNPLAAVTDQMQGAISNAVGQVSGLAGAAGLVSALTGGGGLSEAMERLSQAAGLLSGTAMPGAGQFGLLDMVSHSSVLDMLGDHVPIEFGFDRVTGPLTALDLVEGIAVTLSGVVEDVVAGHMPIGDALVWVVEQTAALDGIASASADALQGAQDAAEALAAVSSTAAALVDAPPALQSVLPLILRPGVQSAMQSAVASHVVV